MNSNTAKVLAVAALAVAAFLLLVQPWRAQRYDGSPAGLEARRLDQRVDSAIESHDTWDPGGFLGDAPAAGIDYPAMLAGLSHAEALALVRDLRAAGAGSVLLINVRSAIQKSAGPEAIAVALPQDPAKRQKLWACTSPFFARIGQASPPDLRQKYLYLPLRASALTTTRESG